MIFTNFLSYTHGIKTWSWQEAGIYAQCLGETPAKSMVPTNQLDNIYKGLRSVPATWAVLADVHLRNKGLGGQSRTSPSLSARSRAGLKWGA